MVFTTTVFSPEVRPRSVFDPRLTSVVGLSRRQDAGLGWASIAAIEVTTLAITLAMPTVPKNVVIGVPQIAH